MQRRRFGIRLAMVLAVVALVAAACGDDDEEDGPSGSSSGSAAESDGGTTTGVTDTSVKVAGLGTIQSAGSVTYAGVEEGARALFERVNAEGGVHGRTIDFLGVRDERLDNAVGIEEARRLVERDEVFAVVPIATARSTGANEVFQRAGVPYFGWGTQTSFCGPEMAFGFSGCLVSEDDDYENLAWPNVMRKAFPDAKTIGAISEEGDPGPRSTGQILAGAERYGFEEVYRDTSMAYENVDFTPFVQEIVEADPDILLLVLNGANAVQMAGRLKAAGYDGHISAPTVYDPRALAVQAAAQALEGTSHHYGFAPFESDNPGIAQLKADVEKYAPGTQITQPVAAGYFSALLFVEILEATGEDLTREAFLETANSGFSFDAGGAIGEITFPEAHETNPNCGSLSVVRNARFETLVGLSCPDPDM